MGYAAPHSPPHFPAALLHLVSICKLPGYVQKHILKEHMFGRKEPSVLASSIQQKMRDRDFVKKKKEREKGKQIGIL